jgi:pimeloyl-ACP methyl ester carboxylesterase
MPKQKIGDINLYYEIHGDGEPILFIHGLGSSSRDWELQVPIFSESHLVVLYDVRGHGKSDKPAGPYSMMLFAQDTIALIKALDIAPVHVVGISMGGMIGLQLGVSAPELVKSLVVVNSGPEMVVRTMKDWFQVMQRQLLMRVFGLRKTAEVLSERMFPKEEHEDIRKMFVARWIENDPRAYREAFQAIVGWTVVDQLQTIQCPVLVVAADEDYTPVESKAAYVKLLPQGELVVIEDSRHATPVEKPEEFNRVIMRFLMNQD